MWYSSSRKKWWHTNFLKQEYLKYLYAPKRNNIINFEICFDIWKILVGKDFHEIKNFWFKINNKIILCTEILIQNKSFAWKGRVFVFNRFKGKLYKFQCRIQVQMSFWQWNFCFGIKLEKSKLTFFYYWN